MSNLEMCQENILMFDLLRADKAKPRGQELDEKRKRKKQKTEPNK